MPLGKLPDPFLCLSTISLLLVSYILLQVVRSKHHFALWLLGGSITCLLYIPPDFSSSPRQKKNAQTRNNLLPKMTMFRKTTMMKAMTTFSETARISVYLCDSNDKQVSGKCQFFKVNQRRTHRLNAYIHVYVCK